MSGVQTIVVQIEKWHGELLAKRFLAAKADAIQNGSGIHHAAKGTEQVQERLRCETDQITTGIDWLVIEMADGAFGGFLNAATQIKISTAERHAYGPTAAWFSATFFGTGIQVEAGLRALHVAECPLAVEVNPFAIAFA